MHRRSLVVAILVISSSTLFSLYGQAPAGLRNVANPVRQSVAQLPLERGAMPVPLGATFLDAPLASGSPLRFLDAPEYRVGANAVSIAAGDFNHDGNLDVVTVCISCAGQHADGVTVLLGNGDGTYQSRVPYASGGLKPQAVAVDDFNGDGALDIAVVNDCATQQECQNSTTQGSVSILLGNGDGSFQPAVGYRVGYFEPNFLYNTFVAIGRLNNDTAVDLVVTNPCGEDSLCKTGPTVSVLLGNGDGTFGARSDYDVGSQPEGVAIADLNRDGHADLAVSTECGTDSSCGSGGTVSILLGNGDGTFRARTDYAAGDFPTTVAIADFNRDGNLDLAVPNSCVKYVTCEYRYNTKGLANQQGVVAILLGNGDGTFQKHVDYYTGIGPYGVASADLDGDGVLDLAVSSPNGTVSILLGRGDGSFNTHVEYGAGVGGGYSLAIGDADNDGKQDILVADTGVTLSTLYLSAVTVMINRGDGTFRSRVDSVAGPTIVGEALGDLNGDGKVDLVTADASNSTIAVALGTGYHTYQLLREYRTGANLTNGVTLADFNGDGKLDVAAVNTGAHGVVSIFLGNGDGTLQDPVKYPTGGNGGGLVAADLNSDNVPDLVVANTLDKSISVLIGNGDGTFQTQVVYSTGVNPNGVIAADFNHDGKMDVAEVDATIGVFLGNGDGTLRPRQQYVTGNSPRGIATTDFNGDGIADLVVASCGPSNCPNETGFVSVSLGKGDGSFAQNADYPLNCQADWLAVGDFRGHGTFDVVTANSFCDTASILLGNGDGTLQPPVDYRVVGAYYAVVARNGDIVLANGNSVSVLPNLGVTVTKLTSSPNPSKAGQAVTFMANVMPNTEGGPGLPTGKVTFKSGSLMMTVNVVNGVAQFTTSQLKAGSYKFTASYAGDNFFNPSTSMTITQIVNP